MGQTSIDEDQAGDDVARGRVVSLRESTLSLQPAGTEYKIDLVVDDQSLARIPEVGKRVKGRLTAQALRLHEATAGGLFIEPLEGAPRIVAGRIRRVDSQARRLLVEAVVPFWIQLHETDDPEQWEQGQLINCYVQSNTSFTIEANT